MLNLESSARRKNTGVSMKTILQCSMKVCILLVISIEPGYVFAQALEEIIVTAQRREQTLQEVPISINVMTGNELQRQGMSTL